ncbi:helix-turn-helix domain-containing protein [Actinomadura nitritigenes]|uniref:helix-turn-helix domain-containing protein n=1 Tax=Actinomadura nitritigenes TaxID=134602 RepID=UPI003D8A1878
MTFGEKLRALMAERGISQRRLAAQVPCDDGYISKLINGRKRPSREIAERLDGLLGAGGGLAALRPRLPAKRAARVELSALGLAAAVQAASTHRGPVAPELADYFRDQLAGHYRADRYLGPLRLIPTGLAQYELLCELANAARGTLRPRMWALAAGYAGFLGWLYQDAGDIGRAVYWHDVMLERAHRSHDPHLVAFALHGKAMLHADLLDGHGVIDLAGAALVHADALAPKVRVLALQQMAHGASLVADEGARDECARLLDQAAALVDLVDDEYPWGTACLTPHYLDIQRATCLVRLGRASEALTIWERIIPELAAAGARRDVGVFRARQAQAYALNGEPERAVTIAGEVVDAATGTGSVRMVRELQGLRARMRPWVTEQPGRLLAEMLAPLEDT